MDLSMDMKNKYFYRNPHPRFPAALFFVPPKTTDEDGRTNIFCSANVKTQQNGGLYTSAIYKCTGTNNCHYFNVVNRIFQERSENVQLRQENNTTVDKSEKLANRYNEKGILQFKRCKYKLSIICFRKGLMLDFKNDLLRANMWNNLSAVYYLLQNYKSSLVTAERALELMPGYEIAFLRAINCCIYRKDFDKSLYYCHIYLGNFSEAKKIEMEKCLIMNIEDQRTLKEINKRKLRVDGQIVGDKIGDINIFNTDDPDLIPRVRLTENRRLLWSVLFYLPEPNATVIVPNIHEDVTFFNLLESIFNQRAPWGDDEGKYKADTLNVYNEISDNTTTRVLKKVRPEYTLSNVLTSFRCPIKHGLPTFIIVISGGKYENENLEDYVEYVLEWLPSKPSGKTLETTIELNLKKYHQDVQKLVLTMWLLPHGHYFHVDDEDLMFLIRLLLDLKSLARRQKMRAKI
ncbi:Tetratricopeptide repeat,BESS motif,Tetratricopeptide repeat-containing [Cinara cedri]|uniref:Tetratricopeptide repeat,BESS motif,Tetratricopeptide repeat-containing n=1 Tax=Cinara cedri TaxID=506608 RepID=A0A5E4NEP4_9HEMI|nr:Tetratricopeptide repeat,BESS motif,Tetratricopeptide repeat-containing [Cinara cedri]